MDRDVGAGIVHQHVARPGAHLQRSRHVLQVDVARPGLHSHRPVRDGEHGVARTRLHVRLADVVEPHIAGPDLHVHGVEQSAGPQVSRLGRQLESRSGGEAHRDVDVWAAAQEAEPGGRHLD
ncbi:MAG: hypothetical protein M3474_08305 [Actinomycetota bacterium]|nr:hypothetical protein [Actinomycetota bacterium]